MTALIYKDVWQENGAAAESSSGDATGTAVVNVGECALVLVSDEPVFKFQNKMLELIFENVIFHSLKKVINN